MGTAECHGHQPAACSSGWPESGDISSPSAKLVPCSGTQWNFHHYKGHRPWLWGAGDGITKQDSRREGTHLPQHDSPQDHVNPGVQRPAGGNSASLLPSQLVGLGTFPARRVGGRQQQKRVTTSQGNRRLRMPLLTWKSGSHGSEKILANPMKLGV